MSTAWHRRVGQGYATEAARAVVEYALGPLGLPQVLAEIDKGDTTSAAVAERLGMIQFDVVPGQLGPTIRYRSARRTATKTGGNRSGWR